MPLKQGAINQILPFAPEGSEDAGDIWSLVDYEASILRVRGHQPGIAERGVANRTWRQTAHMAAGLAQFVANRFEPGVLDDGDLDKIEAGIVAAITVMMPDYGEILAEQEFLRKLKIGAPRWHRSTILPPRHAWVNGDFIEFIDWPEFYEVYAAGGFSGLVLPWNASSATIAANLGAFRPDAANPSGLFLPSHGDQFLRAWVSGLARQAGSWETDTMRNVTGQFSGYTSGTWNFKAFSGALYSKAMANGGLLTLDGGATGLTGVGLDLSLVVPTGTETAGKNVAQPMCVYLGRPA
jgi:hypothetical protein